MYDALDWLWADFQAHTVLYTLIVCLVIVILQLHHWHQTQLRQLFMFAPNALVILDESNQKLILANSTACQILGIRKVGKEFKLPDRVTQCFIKDVLIDCTKHAGLTQTMNWPVSGGASLVLNLTGKRSLYKRRHVWILHFSVKHPTHSELKQQVESLSTIKSAFDNMSELIFVKNLQGEVIASNRAFQRFWLNREDEGLADIQNVMKGRASYRKWTVSPEGRSCLLESYQNTLMNSHGEKIGTLSISHDVTGWYEMQQSLRDEMEKRKSTEAALAQRDSILQSILESSPDSIGIFNENMVYQACNEPFVKALGISRIDDLLGKRLQDVIPKASYERLSETDNKVLSQGVSLRYIDRIYLSDGSSTWYDVVKSPFRDPVSGTFGVLVMARDVSERYLVEKQLEAANEELEKLSFIDGLTQICNRRRFDERLETLWFLHIREQSPLCVMLCDVDYFKGYNDEYGHQMGDEALIKVADIFKSVINRSSDCVARYGGEEFAFILPNTNTEGALQVAERIHSEIGKLSIVHKTSSVSDRLTVSIGLACFVPAYGTSSEKLVSRADIALYKAKANGRNRTHAYQMS